MAVTVGRNRISTYLSRLLQTSQLVRRVLDVLVPHGIEPIYTAELLSLFIAHSIREFRLSFTRCSQECVLFKSRDPRDQKDPVAQRRGHSS